MNASLRPLKTSRHYTVIMARYHAIPVSSNMPHCPRSIQIKRCQLINDYATCQVPATIGWAVYEQAGPGRVLGSGNISVGRSTAGPARVYCTLGRVLSGRAGPDFRQDHYKLRNRHCSYTLPQCNYNAFKHSFVNWCLFTL